ncbi:MAG: GGDEF domain-containing protein [Lachnospiraceae bacterium]|nr:GGDEF domain-containing protein [Lachnospiraceae bacterium]
MDNRRFHPINRNITITVTAIVLVMILITSFVTYRTYTRSFYERYRTQMESIVTYAQQYIDDDDMSKCADTYTESAKYKETQARFDNFVDHYSDLHFLYIIKITDPGDPVGVRSILAANSTYEKENEEIEPKNVLHLGDGEESWYDDDTVEEFREILNGNEDVFFLQPSAWGVDYTLARPLIDSSGKHYGLLCVDISGNELKDKLYRSIFLNIAMIVFLGAAMVLVLLWWMRVFVTGPLRKLEDSVREYAESSLITNNPDDLLYIPPNITINNEIKVLSESIAKMSINIRDYAKNIIVANKKVEGLEDYVTKINDVAYYDPLTKVKNMAAYEQKREELEDDIYNMNARFAIVMADVNNLKKINDKYGHDRGNEYIIGVCRILSDIFKRSPIYRIGGDEFVIVLEGKDYLNREELKKTASEELGKTAADNKAKPWNRYSAAIGMSVYVQDEDTGVEEVFKRADEEMYSVKAKMKAARD